MCKAGNSGIWGEVMVRMRSSNICLPCVETAKLVHQGLGHQGDFHADFEGYSENDEQQKTPRSSKSKRVLSILVPIYSG
jgi:hypothetical protein